MSLIEQIDHEKFVSYLSKTKNTICGRHPIGVLLSAIQNLQTNKSIGEDEQHRSKATPQIRFIHYAQSSQVTSEKDSSVSYASAYVYLP